MEKLKETFQKNGMEYRIIKRSETRYIAEINGRWLETGRIIVKKPKTVFFGERQVVLGERESIPDNEHFAKDPAKCEKCMRSTQKEKIEEYFHRGNTYDFLQSSKQGTPKVVPTIPPKVFPLSQTKKMAYVPSVA